MMDVMPVLEVLASHRVRFVVVGSAARQLVGEEVQPADLDVVLAAGTTDRCRLTDALIDLGAHIRNDRRWCQLMKSSPLPWDWGWTVITGFGEIDVIARFIDGTKFIDHDRLAEEIALPGGVSVRCHPTVSLS